jgi:hypothetical protein
LDSAADRISNLSDSVQALAVNLNAVFGGRYACLVLKKYWVQSLVDQPSS